MGLVDLTDGPAATVVPARLLLQLDELALLARLAGDVPLPVTTSLPDAPDGSSRMEQRLSGGDPTAEEAATTLLREQLRGADPEAEHGAGARLREAQLLTDGGVLPDDLASALAQLGAPEVMITLDLAVRRRGGETPLRSWFAVSGHRVVQLATVNGLRYELAWYAAANLRDALERAATVELPAEPDSPAGDLPDVVRLPYDLMIAGVEAVRTDREDLLDELVRMHTGQVTRGAVGHGQGEPVDDDTARGWVRLLETGARGRMRLLAAAADRVADDPAPEAAPDPVTDVREPVVGLLSFLLLPDGWRWLEPRSDGPVPAIAVRRVAPDRLGQVLAPVLAEVLS